MTEDPILANARLILADEVVTGSLRVRDGRIADIAAGAGVPPGAVDCAGDYVAPGLIELHTDNLERHMRPRPRVDWPHRAAIIAHDAELASVGITTVFDAIRAGSIVSDHARRTQRYAREMADEILAVRDAGALKISHHLHLRAEVCSETLLDELAEFGPDDRIGIVSLMDHTPGQRQFVDLAKFEAYLRGKYGLDARTFADHVDHLYALRERLGARHEAAAVAAAARYGAALASHDDSTAEQVARSHAHGVRLGEFPTTGEAAAACRRHGIGVIGGAPNLVRGASHSGNVAVQDLAEGGWLDILSSDYVPAALLMGAVRLGEIWGDLARGIATVTAEPAVRTGLTDRGRLEIGARADLIRFATLQGTPMLRAVWSEGRRAA